MSGDDSYIEGCNPVGIVTSPRFVPNEGDTSLFDTSGIYFGPPSDKPSGSGVSSCASSTENIFEKTAIEMCVDIDPLLLQNSASARSPYVLRSRSSLMETSPEACETSVRDSECQTEPQMPAGRVNKKRSAPAAQKTNKNAPKAGNKGKKDPKPKADKQKKVITSTDIKKTRNPPKRQRFRRHPTEQLAVEPQDNQERINNSPATPLQTIPEDNAIVQNQRYVINLNIHIPDRNTSDDVILRAEMIENNHENNLASLTQTHSDQVFEMEEVYNQPSTSSTQQTPLAQMGYSETANNSVLSDEINIGETLNNSWLSNEINHEETANNSVVSNKMNLEETANDSVISNELNLNETANHSVVSNEINVKGGPDGTTFNLEKVDTGVQTDSPPVQIKVEVDTPSRKNKSQESNSKKNTEKKIVNKTSKRKKENKCPRNCIHISSDSSLSESSCSCSDCDYSTSCSCSSCLNSYTSDSYSD